MLSRFVPVFGDAGGVAEVPPLYCPAVQLAPVGPLSYPSPARHVALAPLAADPPDESVPHHQGRIFSNTALTFSLSYYFIFSKTMLILH